MYILVTCLHLLWPCSLVLQGCCLFVFWLWAHGWSKEMDPTPMSTCTVPRATKTVFNKECMPQSEAKGYVWYMSWHTKSQHSQPALVSFCHFVISSSFPRGGGAVTPVGGIQGPGGQSTSAYCEGTSERDPGMCCLTVASRIAVWMLISTQCGLSCALIKEGRLGKTMARQGSHLHMRESLAYGTCISAAMSKHGNPF